MLSLLRRIFLYTRAYCFWYLSGTRFASKQPHKPLPHQITSHQSPLFRELNRVDQELQLNKVHNLRIAIQHLNGLIIQPGETFSYWRYIGNPTAQKGYKQGMILVQGRIESGIGGGLCQLSNLMYWMTLHTPLTITKRWRHSYDVFPDANRTQPFGSGATCSYPNIDLQIQNTTNQAFQLQLELSETHLIGSWRSTQPISTRYSIEEQNHRMEHTAWGGYMRSNELYKATFDIKTGAQLRRERIATNTAIMMYDPLLTTPSIERKQDPLAID